MDVIEGDLRHRLEWDRRGVRGIEKGNDIMRIESGGVNDIRYAILNQ
jgi:hypothetical protein